MGVYKHSPQQPFINNLSIPANVYVKYKVMFTLSNSCTHVYVYIMSKFTQFDSCTHVYMAIRSKFTQSDSCLHV